MHVSVWINLKLLLLYTLPEICFLVLLHLVAKFHWSISVTGLSDNNSFLKHPVFYFPFYALNTYHSHRKCCPNVISSVLSPCWATEVLLNWFQTPVQVFPFNFTPSWQEIRVCPVIQINYLLLLTAAKSISETHTWRETVFSSNKHFFQ